MATDSTEHDEYREFLFRQMVRNTDNIIIEQELARRNAIANNTVQAVYIGDELVPELSVKSQGGDN